MRVKLLNIKGSWREVADSARTTIGLEGGKKEPTENWIKRMLLAEHSPIRKLHVCWKWYDLKYWVSTHFVRHKIGIEHWVRTQRSDRINANRNEFTQGREVEHECEANAQAIINISRKRLCVQASPETREAWLKVLESIKNVQPELYEVCVPDCVYRGWCYEYNSCGFHKSERFKVEINKYRQNINGWEER